MKTSVKCSFASAIGERNYQEDRYVLYTDENGWLLGTMDGHNGEETAEFCHINVVEIFKKVLKSELEKNLLRTIVLALHEKTKNFESGSTISLVFIPKSAKRAHVAILGDSPVVIKNNEGVINISPEHNARTNISERECAKAKGADYDQGYIWVGDRGPQMTRSLGDRVLRSVLNDEPEIYEVELGPESFVMVVSDGVIDPGHKNSKIQIEHLVKLVENGDDAQKIVDDAVSRRTRDNATAVLWKK